jgi:hypothetical protein
VPLFWQLEMLCRWDNVRISNVLPTWTHARRLLRQEPDCLPMVTGGTKAHSIVATNVVTHDTSPPSPVPVTLGVTSGDNNQMNFAQGNPATPCSIRTLDKLSVLST